MKEAIGSVCDLHGTFKAVSEGGDLYCIYCDPERLKREKEVIEEKDHIKRTLGEDR